MYYKNVKHSMIYKCYNLIFYIYQFHDVVVQILSYGLVDLLIQTYCKYRHMQMIKLLDQCS